MIIKKQAKKKKQCSGDVYCVCRHVMDGAMIAYACNEQTGHSAGTILCAECKVMKPDWHDDTQPQGLDCSARLGIICADCFKRGIVQLNADRCAWVVLTNEPKNDDTLMQFAAQMYGKPVDSGFVVTDGDKKYVMLAIEDKGPSHLAAIYLYTADNIMRPISKEDFVLAGGIIALAEHLKIDDLEAYAREFCGRMKLVGGGCGVGETVLMQPAG